MGEGNFSGGGSVTWEVKNSDGEYGGGDKSKVTGKDKDPKEEGAMFRVTVNGQLAALVPVKGTTIKVDWGGSTGS
ncbi:MAG TPA: hypothetical protein VI485_10030 [Vicinamibacterales bacterium]|nr:hypothetical protein [Vicinamibacterales bacterium]